jgi:pimeloyl-ACP methyl ester carboxylesterase
VYLDGGPGSSAIALARSEAHLAAFQAFREAGDVILLDQRGVGLSRPSLRFPMSAPLPLSIFESRDALIGTLLERAKPAIEHFRKQGVDLAAYNTEQSADDVDDLRVALGEPKVSILGFSYGTHLALSVVRRHGDRLNRAVLIGTEGPNDTVKLPSEGDRQIERIAKLVAAEPELSAKIPDFKALVAQVMRQLEREPASVSIRDRAGGPPLKMNVGLYGFQHLLCRDLGDTNDLVYFPAGFFSISKGDFWMIAQLAEKRYYQYGSALSAMTLFMDASSGASKDRVAQVEREATTALFGNAMNLFGSEFNPVLGDIDLGEAFRAPILTPVPTLFISGTLDWNTPPRQAEEVRRTFRNSEHLVIESAGHEDMLVNRAVQALIVDYLKGGSTKGATVLLPKLKFTPIRD